MAAFYPSFDLIRVDANGARVVLASTTISAYNVTASASLGTLASDSQGVVVSGSFTADAGDLVRFTHATYPGEHYVTLKSTKDEAFSAAENAPVFTLENLYTNTNEARAVQLYAQDTDNPDKEPVYIGTGKPGETVSVPMQSALPKTYKIFGISEDDFGTKNQADFNAIADEEIEVPALLPPGAIVPYVISAFTTGSTPDFAAAQSAIGTTDPAVLRFDMPVTYSSASAVSLSDNIFVEFEQDGFLTVSNAAAVVTINSMGALPDSRQIFAGAGKVVLGKNATFACHLEWWAAQESTGDDRAAMTQALLSIDDGKMVLHAGSRTWYVDQDLPDRCQIQGVGNWPDGTLADYGTVFTLPAAVSNKAVFRTGSNAKFVSLRDLTVSIGSREDGSRCFENVGVAGDSATGLEFRNVSFHGSGDGVELVRLIDPDNTAESVQVTFDTCTMTASGEDSKCFVGESPNTIFDFRTLLCTMGVDSYGLYLERCGMVTLSNPDFRGPFQATSPYPVTTTSNRTVTGSITSGTRVVNLTSGTFVHNDIGQRIGSGAWLAYITKIVSSTQAIVSFQPASTITAGTLTIYRFDDHATLAKCCIYTGPNSMGTLVVTGGADEAVEYSYIGGQGHYYGQTSYYGYKFQGRIKFELSMRFEEHTCTWFAGAWECDSGAGIVAKFFGGYSLSRSTWESNYELSQPWGRIDGDVREETAFYFAEGLHVNPADFNDVTTVWETINRVDGMSFEDGRAEDADTDAIVNISESANSGKRLLWLGLRDSTHPGPHKPHLFGYGFARNPSDGALDITGNQTGFIRLRLNGHIAVEDQAYNATTWDTNLDVPTKNAIRDLWEAGAFASLRLKDNAGDHTLNIFVEEDLSANRSLELLVNNADRQLVIAGDATISGTNAGDEDDSSIGAIIAAASSLPDADDTDLIGVVDVSGSNYIKKMTIAQLKTEIGAGAAETTTTIGALINGATAKTTPVDADMVGLMDSAASNILKKLSWANIKATLLAYFNTKYPSTLFSRYADATTSGTTEQTLYTNSIAANTLAADGDSINIQYTGITASNANEKEFILNFASNTIFSNLHDTNVLHWTLDVDIVRVSNTVVRCSTRMALGLNVNRSSTVYNEITSINLTSTAYDLVLRAVTPDNAGDITAKMGRAVKYPAP